MGPTRQQMIHGTPPRLYLVPVDPLLYCGNVYCVLHLHGLNCVLAGTNLSQARLDWKLTLLLCLHSVVCFALMLPPVCSRLLYTHLARREVYPWHRSGNTITTRPSCFVVLITTAVHTCHESTMELCEGPCTQDREQLRLRMETMGKPLEESQVTLLFLASLV